MCRVVEDIDLCAGLWNYTISLLVHGQVNGENLLV